MNCGAPKSIIATPAKGLNEFTPADHVSTRGFVRTSFTHKKKTAGWQPGICQRVDMGHQRRMVRADLALMLEEPSSEVSWMNIDAYGYCFEDVCVCVKNVCIMI